jgi:two-component system cell cycle response regulator
MNEPTPVPQPRVLIIEDDAASLELMRYLLDCYGYGVLAAQRGDTGLEMAMRERPDAIICDIQLPGCDGYAVARELRAQPAFAGTPLVAVTALAMVGDRERVMSAGFTTYVSKPIDPESFVTRLGQLIGTPRRPDRSSPAALAPPPQALPPLPHTLLVVDDSPANLELTRSIFEPFGYRVLTTDTVNAALELARSGQPDLVISDVQLAQRDGFELLGQLKADPALSHIPFVFITSTHDDEAIRARALQLGAERFLLRPMEPQRLLQEVAACLCTGEAKHGVHSSHR